MISPTLVNIQTQSGTLVRPIVLNLFSTMTPLTPLLPACFGLFQAIFGSLTKGITHQEILSESCLNPQKTWQVFHSAMKKNFGFCFSAFLRVTSLVK